MIPKFVKLHPDAVLPTRPHQSDSGMDLYAIEDTILLPGVPTLVRTGLAVVLPKPEPWYITSEENGFQRLSKVDVGFEAQIRPRSGLALKHGVTVVNAPGTVDNGYRGEIGVILRWDGHAPNAWSGTHFDSELETYSACYLTAKEMIEDPSYLRSSPCHEAYKIRKGERIAQMVLAPVLLGKPAWGEMDETTRGDKGFGSSGK